MLKTEILETAERNPGRGPRELLVILNKPHRIMERGFAVDAARLLELILKEANYAETETDCGADVRLAPAKPSVG